jgi:hypothetical protein
MHPNRRTMAPADAISATMVSAIFIIGGCHRHRSGQPLVGTSTPTIVVTSRRLALVITGTTHALRHEPARRGLPITQAALNPALTSGRDIR